MPVGFLAAITKGQDGAELTEMVELAERGRRRVHRRRPPGRRRRAHAPRAPVRRRRRAAVALHCEEPTLSRGGHMHEGAVSAELGFGGYPSVAESVMVERDLALAALRGAAAPPAPPLRPRVGRRAPRAREAAGVAATAEVTPHHLCLTDEAVRASTRT